MNHLTRGENVNYYTTDVSSYSMREHYPLHHRWTCLHVYIILLEARMLTITPAMNHLTRGENVNYYTTDESSYSMRERYPLHHRCIILLEARTLIITPPMNHLTRGENINYLHHRWIILLEARTLSITPSMNLSKCIHHLTRGENVNNYTSD
jgi:metallophosphoesterase superfamily enzyme